MKVRVTKDEISIEENAKIHKGEYNVTEIEFSFSEEYANLVKKAIFETKKDKIEVKLVNDKCKVPAQILTQKNFSFNLRVYGYKEQDNELQLRYSPSYITIPLYEGSYVGDTVQIPTGGGDANLQDKTITITENTTQTVSADTGYDGINTIEITTNVPTSGANLESRTETITENNMSTTIYPELGYDGFSDVTISVDVPLQEKYETLSNNGTHIINPDDGYEGLSSVEIEVDVPQDITVQNDKQTIVTDNNTTITIMPDSGYDAMSRIDIEVAVPSSGSGIDLTSGVKFGNSEFQSIPSDILNLNWEDVTDAMGMFYNCNSLSSVGNLETTNVTTFNQMFSNCLNLTTITSIDTSSGINFNDMFSGCSHLITAPTLDLSNAQALGMMFAYCTSLTTVPEYDTENVINMSNMFYECPLLSNISLNNILAMCTKATDYTYETTLKGIGLTETQANTCKTLSNWDDCQSAGWTTGYEKITYNVSDIRNQSSYSIGVDPDLDELYGMPFILVLNDTTTGETIEGEVDVMGYYNSYDGTFSCQVSQSWVEDPETGDYYEYDLTNIQSNQ